MVYLQATLDSTFGALADPTRRSILMLLAGRDATISELAGRFDMSLPAVSKHVRVLERAGLTAIRKEGRARHATLKAARLRDAAQWIERYRAFWEHQLDLLSAYVEQATNEENAAWPKQPKRQTRRSKSDARSQRRASASSRRGHGPKK